MQYVIEERTRREQLVCGNIQLSFNQNYLRIALEANGWINLLDLWMCCLLFVLTNERYSRLAAYQHGGNFSMILLIVNAAMSMTLATL